MLLNITILKSRIGTAWSSAELTKGGNGEGDHKGGCGTLVPKVFT